MKERIQSDNWVCHLLPVVDSFYGRVGWTALPTTKFSWSVKITAMQNSEFCNIWAGSEIS